MGSFALLQLLVLLHATAAQQGLQVLHDAHCVEARASFLGAHLQETNGSARVALDLQLTALSTCDEGTKVLVDASADYALADGDDGLEVCVLWVSTTGANRRTSRCYARGQPARVEWDLTASMQQRYPVWKSKFRRPTRSTRCCLHNCVCSMAWRFYAIDAALSLYLRLLDDVKVHSGFAIVLRIT